MKGHVVRTAIERYLVLLLDRAYVACMAGKAKVIRLVQREVSLEALRAAQDLIARIKSGDTVGFAIVEMHALKDWTYDAVGACKTHPALTRGHICGLSDELGNLPDIP